MPLPTDAQGRRQKYGRWWPPKFNDLDIELMAFKWGIPKEKGGLGKAEHFRRIVRVLWDKASGKPFIWHPWANDMLEEACTQQYVSTTGCGSSGKTDFSAIWGIVNYCCAPQETLVMVTSTSLKDSRKRIWGSIKDYWLARPGLPGELKDSYGSITLPNHSDRCGIHLVAGEKKYEKEAVGKLIGMKNKRVFLIADELPELAESILQAAFGNMALNPEFHMFASGNANSYFDPHGIFSEPIDGWNSVTVEDTRWKTKHGVCLHFDALKSVNYVSGRNTYPIIAKEKVESAIQTLDENSLMFWRMFRGFWCPVGDETCIYSEPDMIKYGARGPVSWGMEPVLKVAGFDPAYTTGGDRCILWISEYGRDQDGKMVINFLRKYQLFEDVTNKQTPRNFQIAEKFRDKCLEEGVLPENAAFDATGSIPFADIVHKLWSPKVLAVCFGGAPSDLPVSVYSQDKSSDRYVNRISELWHVGHEFLRNQQLRGITDDMAKEMCSRKYKTQKAGDNVKVKVESKEDMKMRTSDMSPDIADAAMVVIDLLRSRRGAIPGGEHGLRIGNGEKITPPWQMSDKIKRYIAKTPVLSGAKGFAKSRFRLNKY